MFPLNHVGHLFCTTYVHVKVGIGHVKVGLRLDRSTSGSIDFALQVAWRILRLFMYSYVFFFNLIFISYLFISVGY